MRDQTFDTMAASGEEKLWGKRPFWGVSYDYDPQWLLDEEQKKIQKQLVDLCRTTLRHNAVSCNKMQMHNMSVL